MIQVIVPLYCEKIRLDLFLSSLPEILSRNVAQALIKEGKVKVNQKTILVTKTALSAGDKIDFPLVEKKKLDLFPIQKPLEIFFEDEHLLVVYKETGVVVHPSAGHEQESLIHYILAHTNIEDSENKIRPGIVHRLDKDTSGLLVVAKKEKALRLLSEAFANREVHRLYDVFLDGKLKSSIGRIDRAIGRSKLDRKKQSIREDGRVAITNWKKKKNWKKFSWAECKLETGRTHQIRVHMASIGNPVVGDPLYGKVHQYFHSEEEKKYIINLGMGLHATELGFRHPITNKELLFKKELPSKMQDFITFQDKENHLVNG